MGGVDGSGVGGEEGAGRELGSGASVAPALANIAPSPTRPPTHLTRPVRKMTIMKELKIENQWIWG